MALAYLGIGSNLGERRRQLGRALWEIGRLPATRIVRASRLYRTEPWAMAAGAPHFLNACARIETLLGPAALMDALQAIERRMGRHQQRGPQGQYLDRPIDLDLLFYGDLASRTKGPAPLEIPHPEIEGRRFVLAPLCEIAQALRHPVSRKTMARLLEECDDSGRVWAVG